MTRNNFCVHYSEKLDVWLAFHSTVELSIMLDRPNLMVILEKHYDQAKDYYKRKALHFACDYGAFRCVEYLLSARGSRDIDAIDDSNWQHILFIPMSGDLTLPTDENVHDGRTPLMLGVKHGFRIVEMLIDAGASVTVALAATESTALHCAVSSVFSRNITPIEDLPKVMTLLMRAGCDVDAIEK